jgi:hypothetical protein
MVLLHLPVRATSLRFPLLNRLTHISLRMWTVGAFVLLLLTYVRLNPQRPKSPESKRHALKNIDFVGIILLGTGLTLVYVRPISFP